MKNIKITKIDIYNLKIPLAHPYWVSYALFEHANNTIVRIHTNTGIYGIGEGCPGTRVTGDTQETNFEMAQILAKILIGKNPLAIEARMQDIHHLLDYNTTVKSAFDIALYDLLAKQAGLPLYALLGGENRTLYTDYTVGIDEHEVMKKEAVEYIQKGYPALKVKLGTNKKDDVERIHIIREAIGDDIPIRIDANQGWDVNTAIQTLRELEKYDIQYCEEPVACWDNKGLKRVRDHSIIPIMADESIHDHHDAFRLADMGACDIFNIKMAKSSGIHTALKINAIGEGAGIKCMVGCMDETRLALTAAAHLVSARPNIVFADLDSHLFLSEDPVVGGMIEKNGVITLPDTPGHGADIPEEKLNTYESITISE